MYILIFVGDETHDVYYVSGALGGLSLDRCGVHALRFLDLESMHRMKRYIYKEYFIRVSDIYVPYLSKEVSND